MTTDKGIMQMFQLAAVSKNCTTLFDISSKIEKLSSENIVSCLNSSEMPGLLFQIINIGVIHELPNKEQYEYDENDFSGTADKTEAVLTCFLSLFTHFNSIKNLDNAGNRCLKNVLPSLLLLVSANVHPAAWNNDRVTERSLLLIENLLKLYSCNTVGEILTLRCDTQDSEYISPNRTIFSKYLQLVKPFLGRDRWKRNPFVKASFVWILSQAKQLSISEHLGDVLPPALNFVDDFVIDNKISGLKCLSHIIANTSSEELRWYGRADVVYEAVKHQLYTKNANLLTDVIPTLLTLTKIIERTPDNIHSGHLLEINKFDEVFQMLIKDAEMENNIFIRRALTSHLWMFVDEMGISVVRHMRSVIDLVSNFLEISDAPEESSRLNVLILLASLIKNAWPRIHIYCKQILKCLLRFVYDLADSETLNSQEVKGMLVKKSEYCLILLRCCCKDIVESSLHELNADETPECIRDIVVKILHTDPPFH